jgi:hypothetical protein
MPMRLPSDHAAVPPYLLAVCYALATALPDAPRARAQGEPAPSTEAPPAPAPRAAPAVPAPTPAPPGPSAAPADQTLHPPRLVEPVELTLPDGVQPPGAIDVVLSLDAEGRVTVVELVQSLGEAGDAAVRDAAMRMRFEPARRGEQPVPSRVGFRFEVVAPEPGAPPSPSTTMPAAAATPAARPAVPQAPASPPGLGPGGEVTFPAAESGPAGEAEGALGAVARVDKPEPGAASRVKLRGRELTMIPGTFGEPLRVVATLPGVARSPYGIGFFVVRGAAFQNTGFFVDGFAVPILYHLGAGPAIIASRLVDQLDFYPGGFPVAYGRYTAGIIALRTAPPAADGPELEVEADLLRAGALAIVPYGEGDGSGSVAVAFRRSYYELILPLITDDVMLSYTDYQLRLDHRFSDRVRASLFFFGSRDAFEAQQQTGAGMTTGTSGAGLSYEFDQLIASLEWKPLVELSLRWSATAGPTTIDFGSEGTGDPSLSTDTSTLRLGQRIEAVYAPVPLLQTTLGFEESVYIHEAQGSVPSFGELPDIPAPGFIGDTMRFEDRVSELEFAPYVEQVVRPWRFELTAGVRVAYLRYGDVETWAADPRGVVRYKLTEHVKLKLASGLFAQPPLPFQIVRGTGNPELAPNRAFQSSAGTEVRLPDALEIDGTLFYSHMYQLTRGSGRPAVDEQGNAVRPLFEDDGRGRAYGFELLLRRRVEQGLFGWLSYTLSRSERFLDGGRTVIFAFDQTHVLNLAASYALGGWTFGARFNLATGRPVGDLLDVAGERTVWDSDEDDFDPDSGGRRIRLPTFHQLDVRIDRAFTVGPVEGSVFLDVINVYGASNSEGYQYEYDYRRRGQLPGLPFLPTIGVKGVLR